MGVGGPIMDLMESTPAASLHWLTAEELKTTGLATIWIDTPSAIDNGDANGISGAPVDPTSDHIAMLHALDLTALPPPTRGPAATLESDFAYRRGGGQVAAVFRVIRVDAKLDGSTTAPGFELQLSSGDGVAPTFRAGFGERLPVRIPIVSFCKIGREVRLSIVRLEGAGPPLALDAKNVPGLKKLMDEACVPVLVKKTGKA
jgi:hypothetical protein